MSQRQMQTPVGAGQQQIAGGLFGQQQMQTSTGGLFGQQQVQPPTGGLFASQQQVQPLGGGLFGQQQMQQSTGLQQQQVQRPQVQLQQQMQRQQQFQRQIQQQQQMQPQQQQQQQEVEGQGTAYGEPMLGLPLGYGLLGGPLGTQDTDSDEEDEDINAIDQTVSIARHLMPGRDKAPPHTWFYLVCGGEVVPEKERQSREQMYLISDIIIRKGMATKNHILFVHGRGQRLNNSVTKNYVTTGQNFRLYGGPQSNQVHRPMFDPSTPVIQKKCPLPRRQDNAVVIFIGQGKYSVGNYHFMTPHLSSFATFGDLQFVNEASLATLYTPTLNHLKAKNTLFICLADYSGEAFRRAFKEKPDPRKKKMLAVCLSDNLHSPEDRCLVHAFSEFFDGEDWKNKTIEDFTQVLKERYAHHPAVQQKKDEVSGYTEDEYEQKMKEAGTWATGNFSGLLQKPIPSYDWAMFREVEKLKRSIDNAGAGDLSTDLKEELKVFFDNMGELRKEAIKKNLHLPEAYEAVGDNDISTKTWRDFLMLQD